MSGNNDSETIGRPSEYSPQLCEIAYQLYLGGATDAEVAKSFGIHPSTLYRWAAKHEEFRDTQKLGKNAADERVVRSLFHRATGYSHKAVKIFCDPKTGANKLIEYEEHYPPDTTACIFWLKNRRPSEWKDKHEVVITDDRTPYEAAARLYFEKNPHATPQEALAYLRPVLANEGEITLADIDRVMASERVQ